MRNWFILFATTFTITTLTLTLYSSILPQLPAFNSQYIVLLAISSAFCTFYIIAVNRLSIQHFILRTLIHIIGLSLIVFFIGLLIQFVPYKAIYFMIILALVTLIYLVITLIYMFILQKETKQMNEQIAEWRNKQGKK